ncbi:MAG: glycosyltransferase family 4 protein [Candidatus Dadabacteria bacterium]|nr:MAG: glycosyltransferase family 4 protein [Candidatus Dadabacteria bacterium]
MRVALVHDWLTGMRGGERCLKFFLKVYPEADIYTLVHVAGSTDRLIDRRVCGTSALNKLPGIGRYYRLFLPLYPSAISTFDFSDYDLVISLSHAAAKNIHVPESVPHLCYCFTPMRYIWDQANSYFGALTLPLWPVIKGLRNWDKRGAEGVTRFAAISKLVKARIRKFYGRRAEIIYPPVDTSWISPAHSEKGEAYLYAGALVPYKRPDLVVEVFNDLKKELWIAGSGPMEKKLRRMAGPNIKFLGRVSDIRLAEIYAACRALIFPGKEDFGMIPVECMAAGRAVIGLFSGGLRETVDGVRYWDSSDIAKEAASGVFFRKSREQAKELKNAIGFFENNQELFSPEVCIRQAKKFSPERFLVEWGKFVEHSVGIGSGSDIRQAGNA